MILVDEPHDRLGGVRRARRILDHDGNAVIETHFVEDMRQSGVAVVVERRAVSPLRPGENEVQTVGAAFEILERLGVGGFRIGDVDAGEDGPAAGIDAQRAWAGRLGAPIERIDRRAVVGLGDELVESSALQGAFDGFAPLVFAGLGKTSRQGFIL